MMRCAWMLLLIVGLCLGLVATGDSQTTTTTMSVSASVASACSVSATPMSFGPLNASSPGGVTSQATVTVTCANGTGYNVALNGGFGAFSNSRHMVLNMSANVGYSLTHDAVGMLPWGDSGFGDTFAAGTVQAGTGTGVAQNYTVYGATGAASVNPLPPGSYTDTVTVTVHF